ncbi:MAG TPA: DUF1801 domain-containing protein [Bacteroidia bacterium]|jgi:uncharacterized protein YdhG (YjbR/CyaY superfamily)|nr:DUF1801 domain-containing protein [Bacteroidia bacterium]
MKKAKDFNEYKSAYTAEIQKKLEQMRACIKKAAPKAEEVISYGMPAFKLNGILVYFAARSKHIGLYPTASGIENFKKELVGYETSRGTVQFPLDKPLPLGLVTQIVKFRVAENQLKAKRLK